MLCELLAMWTRKWSRKIVEIGLANFITISKSFFSAPEQDVMKLFFSTTVQIFSCVCLFDCNFLNCFSLGRTGDGNVEEALEKKNKGLYPPRQNLVSRKQFYINHRFFEDKHNTWKILLCLHFWLTNIDEYPKFEQTWKNSLFP